MLGEMFAIFGNPVEHSRSPLMHNYTFEQLGIDACYGRVHLLDGKRLRERFFSLGLDGANVTVPHKQDAFAACDEVRGFACRIGVVNTLVREDDKLIGYNTDADGFIFAIKDLENIKNILIIGAGGTARALALRLMDEDMRVVLLNRSKARLEPFVDDGFECYSWSEFVPQEFDLVINTTSAGLEDKSLPAPLELLEPLLRSAKAAVDVIYNIQTPFIELSEEMGVEVRDGKQMLLGQGVLAFRHFCKHKFEPKEIEAIMARSFEF